MDIEKVSFITVIVLLALLGYTKTLPPMSVLLFIGLAASVYLGIMVLFAAPNVLASLM